MSCADRRPWCGKTGTCKGCVARRAARERAVKCPAGRPWCNNGARRCHRCAAQAERFGLPTVQGVL